MFKSLTHFGLALALILPPWPLTHAPIVKSSLNISSETMPVLDGQRITPTRPLIFSDTINGLNVTTTITQTPHELIQDVQMTGSKESVSFKFVLDNPIDVYVFTQHIQDKKILTKELIKTNKPNANTGSIYKWRFSSDSNVTLEMLRNGTIAQIQPFVYWTKQGQQKEVKAYIEGSSVLVLEIQEPKESYPLTIDPSIAYGQWLGEGQALATTVAAVGVEPSSGEIYVGGGTNGKVNQAVTMVGTYNGGTAVFVSEVTSANPPVVNWMMYVGGVAGATLNSLTVNGDEIYAGGYTDSSDLWATAGSTVGTVTNTLSGGNEGFVVEIADGSPPTLEWLMWLGGVGLDQVLALSVNGDEIYAGGISYSSALWDTAVSTIGTFTAFSGNSEGYVAEITDGGPPTLEWRIWLGGSGQDIVYALAVNGDEIYAGGVWGSYDSIETFGSLVGTNVATVNEGFVVEIQDGGPPSLPWGMYVGGSGIDSVRALSINGDEIYAGGYTQSSDSWDTAVSTIGTLTNTLANGEGFVVEIADGGPPSLEWRMWLGGVGADVVLALAINGDEIYAGGYANSSASWDTAGSRVGTLNNPGVNQGFVVEIADGSPPSLAFQMWLGNAQTNLVYGLAVNGEAIYAGTYVITSASLETFTVVSGSMLAGGNNAALLAELNDGSPPTYFWLQWLIGSGSSQVNALAVNGDEIYAGGQSYAQTLGTVPDVGTPNYVQEGFVIEITDGATPNLNWRVWLGGDGGSVVQALAINGDEVYVGGYSNSSGSWDTVGSEVGTFTGASDGFVVEIADGSPPTLAWRAWLGGNLGEIVYALALNGDEIYAGGYSGTSAGWDTFGSIVGTFSNNQEEGFLVEIADGGPPTFEWLAFIGGSNHDFIYSLAVVGDEIYAGGASDTSVSWETFASTLGTMTDALYEGFVVEIADGGPPTFEWRHWFGGDSVDSLYALAVNGDEIYAGGYADNSATFETAVISFGTVTNTTDKGFVVEIADGSPPTLAWRMWIGGSGNNRIKSLAISGDEIYASGYTYASGSWATVNSKLGTFTNVAIMEGFTVEISDGSPPSMNWITWLGSIGADDIVALAVSANEVYAGGYVPNTEDMEGVFSGTKYDGQNSAFIVEIADDATAAVMNALFWLD